MARSLACCRCEDYIAGSTVIGFTVCLSNDGRVYSFGKYDSSYHGQKERIISSPTLISSLINITAISCGLYHTLCLDIDGNVFSYGLNYNGQLGIEGIACTYEPQKIKDISRRR